MKGSRSIGLDSLACAPGVRARAQGLLVWDIYSEGSARTSHRIFASGETGESCRDMDPLRDECNSAALDVLYRSLMSNGLVEGRSFVQRVY